MSHAVLRIEDGPQLSYWNLASVKAGIQISTENIQNLHIGKHLSSVISLLYVHSWNINAASFKEQQ